MRRIARRASGASTTTRRHGTTISGAIATTPCITGLATALTPIKRVHAASFRTIFRPLTHATAMRARKRGVRHGQLDYPDFHARTAMDVGDRVALRPRGLAVW